MRRLFPRAAWCGLLAAASAAGCSPPVAQVTGTVKANGRPVDAADLTFAYQGDPPEQFPAHTRDSGAFFTQYRGKKGMPVGKYSVTVTRYWMPNGKPLAEGEAGDKAKQDGRATAETVTFEKELVEGANEVHFELPDRKKP